LVLDLDNTLWGGILGEDGMEGIQIGNTYPGNAFLDFQNNLLELSKNGVILTACSKNNEQDVMEAWNKNPFLQIKKEQLAAWRINWNNKADNIAELAQELNIGLDSMVFIDDNPTERELIKQVFPMVETPEFPKQPYMLPEFFEKICADYFQIYKLTGEDKEKLEQYKANAERTSFQKSFISFDDYLKSLEIILDIQELNSMNLSRIAQMTQKTNQFNLTTKRYTEEDITTFAAQGAKIFCISVSDKFGDSGITGAAIITVDNENRSADIDSFLLSCRILGKNIETTFLKYVLQQLKENGILHLTAAFIPTAKNIQVLDFYEKNGFELVSKTAEGEKQYFCDLKQKDTEIEDCYKIT
jgi:FkbH-like protein